MATKSIIHTDTTGWTVYFICVRQADGYLLDDSDGNFAAAPADPYIALTEHSTVKGRYAKDESRQVWNDGRYDLTFYRQRGGSPAPATDTVIGYGEMYVNDDEEVTAAYTVDMVKWKNNKMVITDNGDGTETIRVYDDDNTTVLKTWTYTTATKTRSKAS